MTMLPSFGVAIVAALLTTNPVLAGSEPDPKLTPSAGNPDVTQDNISTTICVSGWTKTVRPPVSYTNKLKSQQIQEYGYADKALADYEEDHLISLEIGGDPKSPKNLWPEPYAGTCGARVKDVIEKKLNRLVCSGQLSLRAAQHLIATDWVTAYSRFVKPIDCGESPAAVPAPPKSAAARTVLSRPHLALIANHSPVRASTLGQGCRCPYDLAKNGSKCGGRSQWSKAGGKSPVCYSDD